MLTSLALALCTPADSINPFPILDWGATFCAALLSLEMVVLVLTARTFYQSHRVLWLSKLHHLLNVPVLCIAMAAWILAAWLDWQSLHFVTFCSIGGIYAPYHIFQAGQVAVVAVISLTALCFVGGIVLLASQFWLSKTVQRAAP